MMAENGGELYNLKLELYTLQAKLVENDWTNSIDEVFFYTV